MFACVFDNMKTPSKDLPLSCNLYTKPLSSTLADIVYQIKCRANRPLWRGNRGFGRLELILHLYKCRMENLRVNSTHEIGNYAGIVLN